MELLFTIIGLAVVGYIAIKVANSNFAKASGKRIEIEINTGSIKALKELQDELNGVEVSELLTLNNDVSNALTKGK